MGYSTRVAHLPLNLSGGLNGSILLNATTVRDDAAVAALPGGSVLDWLLFAASGIFKDTTKDLATDKVATPV